MCAHYVCPCVHICMLGVSMCCGVPTDVRGQLTELIFIFHHGGLSNQSQIVRVHGKVTLIILDHLWL